MAGSNLDEAMDKTQNNVKIEEVAKALHCAENGQQCITSVVYQQGNIGRRGTINYDVVTYEQDLYILHGAINTNKIFNTDDIKRISKVIELLEQKRLEQSSK
jgi:hypothetical protein